MAAERSLPVQPTTSVPDVWSRVGDAWFEALVDRFYEGVEGDELLRPMYPDDLSASRRHLTMFLIQYWGGPTTYSQERGHPRLRMRHAPFRVDAAARDAWLRHMHAAVRGGELAPADEHHLLDYFDRAAEHLLNQPQ